MHCMSSNWLDIIRVNSIDDIAIGLRTRLTKTVSESDVYLFAGITGDLDPNHVDEEYCRKTSLGHRIAHGTLIVGYTSAASTRILQDFDRPMVSVGYDRIRFLKPVYFGDTLTIDYEITGIEREWERSWAGAETYVNGVSAFFMLANRNLRSVTLNLKSARGVEAARRLAARADVVIENYRPGVLERLGLGFERIREDNPEVIYASG